MQLNILFTLIGFFLFMVFNFVFDEYRYLFVNFYLVRTKTLILEFLLIIMIIVSLSFWIVNTCFVPKSSLVKDRNCYVKSPIVPIVINSCNLLLPIRIAKIVFYWLLIKVTKFNSVKIFRNLD